MQESNCIQSYGHSQVFSRSMNSPQEFGAVTEKYCGELLAFEGL